MKSRIGICRCYNNGKCNGLEFLTKIGFSESHIIEWEKELCEKRGYATSIIYMIKGYKEVICPCLSNYNEIDDLK